MMQKLNTRFFNGSCQVILTTILISLVCPVFAQKPRNYTDVTSELTNKIITTVPSGKALHVAVVPFAATSASVEKSTAFGDYLTETIIGSLTGQPDKIKVFERTRLDAVLKEQEFILTDLMKPAAALKIGELVPIDALLSGTYTKLKSYIDVNARLIDVATGEISVSFNGRIKMTKNIATLFKQDGADNEFSSDSDKAEKSTNSNQTVNISFNGTNTSKSRAEICKQKAADFETRLNDLTSQEKISAAVTEAKKTPFDNVCGQLHYNAMYSFTRYKIYDAPYKTFLLQTLDTIAFPGGDDRAVEIARYISADGEVDDNEWKYALHTIPKFGTYRLTVFNSLIVGKPTTPDAAVVKSRISSYFELASAGKIGLPRPIPFESAYFAMYDGVSKNISLQQFVYEKYASKLALNDQQKATVFSNLKHLYRDEPTNKTAMIKWVIDFVNANEYPKAAEQLYEFANDFVLNGYATHDEEVRKNYRDADLQLLVDGCRAKFSKYAVEAQYSSQREDRIEFCVIHGIAIPGVIPTMEEADAILKGNDVGEQLRITEMFRLMGDRPKKLENSLIGLFSKRSLDEREKLSEAQMHAIAILGNIKTTSPKAVEYMISVLPHYGNDTEAAKVALVQIGKPAVSQLTSKLEKTTFQDGGLQYQLLTLLGKIGKDAASAEKIISRIANTSTNSEVKYAAEAALQNIR